MDKINILFTACIFLFICYLNPVQGQQKDYPIQSVLFTQVKLNDQFWLPRMEINRNVTIPASFARCESTGRVKNFEMAAQKKVNSAPPSLLMIPIFIKPLKALRFR